MSLLFLKERPLGRGNRHYVGFPDDLLLARFGGRGRMVQILEEGPEDLGEGRAQQDGGDGIGGVGDEELLRHVGLCGSVRQRARLPSAAGGRASVLPVLEPFASALFIA